jgi:hypothetical protein
MNTHFIFYLPLLQKLSSRYAQNFLGRAPQLTDSNCDNLKKWPKNKKKISVCDFQMKHETILFLIIVDVKKLSP